MIYYTIIYMADGQIHLMPHTTREKAEETEKEIKAHPKWGGQVKATKIITKDPASETFVKRKGLWIS